MDPLLPDDEELLGRFLREHPAVRAFTGSRVGTILSRSRPAIRLSGWLRRRRLRRIRVTTD